MEVESEFIPVEAINKPVTEEGILNNLSKLGNTSFELNECKIELDVGLLVPISVINDLRRQAICQLEDIRTKNNVIKEYNELEKINCSIGIKTPKVSVYLYDTARIDRSNSNDSSVVVEFSTYLPSNPDKIETASLCFVLDNGNRRNTRHCHRTKSYRLPFLFVQIGAE